MFKTALEMFLSVMFSKLNVELFKTTIRAKLLSSQYFPAVYNNNS